jgi:glutamyl-tRNA reductase
VAGLAVQIAGDAIGGVAGKRAAVLGAGATGKLALHTLLTMGAAHVWLLNRSPERAATLTAAADAGSRVTPGPLNALPGVLREIDLLVCATAAAVPVVGQSVVAAAAAQREGRPLAIVDVAVPRDVEPSVRDVPGVTLLDLDDLEERCAVDAHGRKREMERAEARAREAAAECIAALRLRAVAPDIAALRQSAESIRQRELLRVAGKLRDLTPRERAAVEQLTYTIVQKLLHAPTVALRRTATTPSRRAVRERAAILAALSAAQGRRHDDSAVSPVGPSSTPPDAVPERGI